MTDALRGWSPTPWFLVSAPEPAAHTIRRPRVERRIADAVAGHRVTCVTAPAGYGKTVAVSEWSAHTDLPVAWLTLTPHDDRPARILRGVVSALQELADLTGDAALTPLLGIQPDLTDLPTGYDTLAGALRLVDVPMALVVDDAHLAGDALADSIVGVLAEHAGSRLRIVLVGASRPALPTRLWLDDAPAEVGADDLAFEASELVDVAVAAGHELHPGAADEIHAATSGWPAAVRLALMGHAVGAATLQGGAVAAAGSPALVDYVAGEVLDKLPAELADFVLTATTCTRVNAQLAAVLSRRDDSAAMLEECMRRGLFLDRFAGTGSEPVYRWHDLFAEQCRQVLRRRDPSTAERLDGLAARALADVYPLEAITHAQRAGDLDLAAQLVATHWVGLVVHSQAVGLEAACARFPSPWSTDPAMLIVRACCRDVAGDRIGAGMLWRRAAAVAQPTDDHAVAQLELTRAAAGLMLVDEHADLMAAVDALDAILQTSVAVDQRTYGPLLFLLGWAEMRLRRDTPRAVALLESARRECAATGDHLVARRAAANLSFALAFSGRFRAATELLAELADPIEGTEGWQTYDGGVEAMAAGLVAYYRNELPDAEAHLLGLVAGRSDDAPYSSLARIYLTFVAVAMGDPQRQVEAERELTKVGDDPVHGMPWGTYKLLARCTLAHARDQVDEVLALADQLAAGPYLPVTTTMVAECLRRAGAADRAGELVATALASPTRIPFVDAGLMVTQALLEWTAGNAAEAHRLLEASLDLAVDESVARPFSDDDPDLRSLLVAHVAWGTHHEGFLAALVARTEATVSRRTVLGSPLSRREHEVLGYLRTSMTTAEIAEALYVSVNTIKTHQRAIYRKLGVANRREAVRLQI